MATNADLEALFAQVLAASSGDEWQSIFNRLPKAATLGTKAGTLGMVKSEIRNDAARYQKAAFKHLAGMSNPGQVATIGHTHQPESVTNGEDRYFNTGSWTRYVDYKSSADLTLAKLQREEDFPFELHALYVRPDGKKLFAEMICFERG